MSTYIVAWVNGQFAYLESSYKSSSGQIRPLRIYSEFLYTKALPSLSPPATPDLIDQAKYALEVKAKVLPLYEQIFDIAYPLPKLDTVVVSLLFQQNRFGPSDTEIPRSMISMLGQWKIG